MKRLFLCAAILFMLVPLVSASDISTEHMSISLQPDGTANVTVERNYDTISASQISFLMPARYSPSGMTAYDDEGELDCTLRTFDFGEEIVCEPRQYEDYTVTIRFFGEFASQNQQDGYTFSYVKQVLTPTDRTSLTVTLPEGFGLVSGDTPYVPDDAEVGSEGRRIFLHWDYDGLSTGESIQYSIAYEDLQVFDRIPAWALAGLIIALVLSSSAAALYVRGRNRNEETIASMFPVLKDDEQLVIRYIIDQGGEVEQRDIVENVSYSKAKVSKLLSDLEDRNMVEKEKQGRVNIVKIARDIGDINTTLPAEH